MRGENQGFDSEKKDSWCCLLKMVPRLTVKEHMVWLFVPHGLIFWQK